MLGKLRVGLSPVWGCVFLAIAALDLAVFAMTGSTMQIALAAIMALVGLSHLLGVLLVVDDQTIELKNPLGMTLKTFTIMSPDEIRIEGRKLWIEVDGRAKKISGLMANGSDWAKLADAIAKAKTASP